MESRRYYYNLFTNGQVEEFDFLSNALTKLFSYITRPVGYAVMREDHVGNLDKLSFEQYGDEKLWWVIALVNGIIDPFNDDLVDQELEVPDLLDIFDFYRENFVTEALAGS